MLNKNTSPNTITVLIFFISTRWIINEFEKCSMNEPGLNIASPLSSTWWFTPWAKCKVLYSSHYNTSPRHDFFICISMPSKKGQEERDTQLPSSNFLYATDSNFDSLGYCFGSSVLPGNRRTHFFSLKTRSNNENEQPYFLLVTYSSVAKKSQYAT